jgi:hypothetical protein
MQIHIYEGDEPLSIVTHRSGKEETRIDIAVHMVEVWDGTHDGWGQSLHF